MVVARFITPLTPLGLSGNDARSGKTPNHIFDDNTSDEVFVRFAEN
jgi:hypothetical protein